MDIFFKKSVSEIFNDIKRCFIEKDYSRILDYTILFLFCTAILFVPVYKISINLEKYLFESSYLVLSAKMKEFLPQFLLIILFIIVLCKWAIAARRTQGINEREETDQYIRFTIFNRNISIKKNLLYTSLLLFVLFLYFVGRISYWNISFTMNHPLKYSTYVGPALSMLEHNDPFFIQRTYMHNPLTNSLGLGSSFGNLPLLEWILFVSYKFLLGTLSVEVATRLVMTVLGCISLFVFYIFVKKSFNQEISIIAVFLLAFNSIFNLSSFVTVYDILNFSFAFGSLTLLKDSLDEKNIRKLFVSGILLGIGASIKENILLWVLPVAAIFLLLKYKNEIKKFISDLGIYLLATILPYIIVMVSINYFPTKEPKYFIYFFAGSAILSIIIWQIRKISSFVEKVSGLAVDFTRKHKITLLLIPILIVVFLKLIYSTAISEEFLTDWRLIFNLDLYQRFLTEQIIPYTGEMSFCLFFISIPLFARYNNDKKHFILVISLLAGDIFYIVMASKALFFHSYYWLLVLASIVIITAWGLNFIITKFFKGFFRLLFIFLIFSGLFLFTFSSVKSKLDREYSEVYYLIDYINSLNLEDGTSFVDQGDLTYLTMKTNIYRVYDTSIFADEKFRESVSEIGFVETMKKYKILYLITSSDTPDYTIFANSFSETPLESTSYRRTDQIFEELYSKSYYSDLGLREKILLDNNVSAQFQLVRVFGTYKVYELTDACFNTVIE